MAKSKHPVVWHPPGWAPPGGARLLRGLLDDGPALAEWAQSGADASWADWLTRLALAPFVWHRLKTAGCTRALAAPLAQALRSAYYAAAADAELHGDELRTILECLAHAGVSPVLFKGAALAYTAYPDPACRPMGDLDLWLTHEGMPPARAALGTIGYRELRKPERPLDLQQHTGGEVQMISAAPGTGLVELHWGIFAGEWVRRTAAIDDAGIRARVRQVDVLGCPASALAPEDAIVQSAVHIAVNHQMAYPGIRALLDVALLSRTDAIDWPILAERARAWRVATATWLVLDLANELFGLPGAAKALAKLAPPPARRRALRRFVGTTYMLEGRDMTGGPRRLAFQLLLVDRSRDAARIVGRTLWPERTWLRARYGATGPGIRVRHFGQAVRGRV